ncbi:MAG: TRAP transporter small permease [Rhodospirillales bacterium]|jgi:TRAP-type mannitol/chloroaromatic compound transport system permease small subunit|nr:TRAP transporter small permease [Rhodospirillales bacterium]
MRRILSAIDSLSYGASVVGGISLFLMSVLMLTEVVCRNFLNFSLVFSWEYSSYLMATAYFFTAAYTLLVRGHVRVGLLAEALPEKARHPLEVVATAFGLFICVYVATAMVNFSYQSFERGARTFLPSETLLWPPQAIIAIGAVLLSLQILARLVRLLIGDEPDAEAPGSGLPE